MNSGITRRAGLGALALGWMTIAGCGGDGDNGTGVEEPVPTTVAITPDAATLASIGATQGFNAVVRDQNGTAMPDAAVSWSGSDAGVFTVASDGSAATVTAAGNGTGTLTATSGEASDTASVEVEQVPTRLDMVSGDEQETARGTALPEPLVVLVGDQGGTGIPDAQVTFLPDDGHGSVSATTVATAADGRASTEWTLGSAGRRQFVTASVGELTYRFAAAATADPPIPDLEFGTLTYSRNEPTVFEPVDITAEILNLGDGATPPTFKLGVLVDGETERTVDVGQLQPDGSGTVELSVGPFTAGSHTINLVLDPDGELEEWDEDNNTTTQSIVVLDQKVISVDESVELTSVPAGSVLLFRVEIDEASDEVLNIALSGGEGDADLFVDFEDRPDERNRYLCSSTASSTTELCEMVPARKGVYHVAVHAWSAFGPTTLSVTMEDRPVEDFSIDLAFVQGGTSTQRDLIAKAAARWDAVIAKGVADADFTDSPPFTCGSSASVTGVVDDLRIYITVDSIDGAGGSDGNHVANSGWCLIRVSSLTPPILREPVVGFIRFDEHDIGRLEEQGLLKSVAVHEMGQVLGFDPFLWDGHGHLKDPWRATNRDADTHFDGYMSVAAFEAVGGAAYQGARVPVEKGVTVESLDVYWRESVFGDEIMTPILTGTVQPLSLVTIEALADLGYGVDLSQADPFSLSVPGRPHTPMPDGPVVDLRSDFVRGPVALYHLKTGEVRIVHPPG
jgi:hypothetical protein